MPVHPCAERVPTMNIPTSDVRIRRPTVADVPAMVAMMHPHVLAERLLPRSPRQVVERLRDYLVAERQVGDAPPQLVALASVALVDTHLAEVGAVAGDDPDVVATLVGQLLDEAREMGVADAFVLTDAPAAYEAMGFMRTDVSAIPEKRDRQCLRCSRLPRCRQVALTLDLGEVQRQAAK